MRQELEKKVQQAIRLLQSIPQDGTIELCYSTGKDSDVILELAKMAGIPFEAIYKNTTIDRPGSIAHAKEMGVTIVQPKKNMFQLIEENGWPSRWARFCCKFLKEYKINDRTIVGIRRDESVARAKRYHEPEYCRVYSNGEKARQYMPILEWSNDDVEQFIKERGLKCHPHYYDKDGNFHVERRVGCIGCPMTKKQQKDDFRKYPKMFRAWVRSYAMWYEKHPDTKTRNTFPSVYDSVFMKIFCDNMDEYNTKASPDLFGNTLDTKAYLEEYFGIEL